MSKSNPSEVKLAVPTSGGFSGLKSLNLQVFVMIAAIIAIMLFFTWTTDGAYLSARNVSNLLRQTAITGILAVGMVFVIISAEIDLSVGSMMGLLGGVAAICDVWLGWPLPLTIIVTLVLGLLLGAWNGWWVAYRKVPSFIVTLAGMLAFRGILIGITNGTTVSPTSAAMSQIGQSYLPASTGFHHWRAWLNGFCWLAMARKNAPSGFGFAVSDLYRSCRSPGINGDYRLRRNLAVERLPWRSHSCSAADVAVTRRNVYGNADGIWTTHLCHRRQSGSSTSLRD